jgi:hypothetical protein
VATRVTASNRITWSMGEEVRVIGLMPKQEFAGVVCSLTPLRAKVTTPDKIWQGCEVQSAMIRKAHAGK